MILIIRILILLITTCISYAGLIFLLSLLHYVFPFFFFFFNDTAPTEISPLSLHDALPICTDRGRSGNRQIDAAAAGAGEAGGVRGGPVCERRGVGGPGGVACPTAGNRSGPLAPPQGRSEEHTSELQSLRHLVCRLLLEKKK